MTRRIAVVTGTRADYGLLRWTMAEIDANPSLELCVIATGTHWSAQFGNTHDEITADGFRIDERVEMLSDLDTPLGVARSTGVATTLLADALSRQSPDLVLVLGDRFEILAATQAALLLGIPVAHIAGGEITEGAVDDAIRHAITKMSHLHFTAAEEYRQRVIQLGENPDRVFLVGAVGLDNLERLELLDEAALVDSLGVALHHPLALCTFHPETLSGDSPIQALQPLFDAVEALPDLQVVITKANADAGGREINERLEAFAHAHAHRVSIYASLGQLRYLSLMTVADVVVGNSSSGILEAPSTGTLTVNIGDRQKGRLRAPSVIDVTNDAAAIRAGIELALTDHSQRVAAARRSPFGGPGAAVAIARILASVDLGALRTKAFHTIDRENTHD